MNSKHSVVFFSVGVILILGLILMGFMPMNTSNIVVPDSQQITLIDEKIELISPQNGYDEKIIQDDKDDNNPSKNLLTKPIEELDCTELRAFAASFEKGWGSAIPLYNEKCP